MPGVHDYGQIDFFDQNPDKFFRTKSLVRPNRCGKRHDARPRPQRQRSLAAVKSGYMYGITINPSFARISRSADRFMIIRQKILGIADNFYFYEIAAAGLPGKTCDPNGFFLRSWLPRYSEAG